MLIAIAAGIVAISIPASVVGALGLVPAPIIVVPVIVGITICARIAFLLRARRSSAASNPWVLRIVSIVGLALSTAAAVGTVVLTVQLGENPLALLADVAAHGWSILLLLLVTIPSRTIGPWQLLGVLLSSFLAVTSAARFIGEPIVRALEYSQLASAVYIPIVEEVLKILPVLLVALIALRNRRLRMAATDFLLLGFASGAGFALNENAQLQRVWADPFSVPPLSFVFPMIVRGPGLFGDPEKIVAGHAIWTAALGLAVGFALLYRRRFRFAWVAIPVALVLVVGEHANANADDAGPVAKVLLVSGMLTTIVLLLALAAIVWFEHRPFARPFRRWALPSREAILAHRADVARRQGVA